MLKFLYISLVLCIVVSAKSPDENYRAFSPKYIYSNSNFDVSIITKNPYQKAEKLDLYIIPDDKIELNSLQLRAYNKIIDLKFSSSELKGYAGSVYKSEIDLTQLDPESFFQIVPNFYSSGANKTSIKFYGVFKSDKNKNDEKVLGYLQRNYGNDLKDEEKFITVKLNFYKPQKSAGKSLKFENNAELKFDLPEFKKQKLLLEFWFKTSSADFEFLNIINKETITSEFKLLINSFQMLNVIGFESNQEYLNPFFISKDCWYHFEIIFTEKDNTFSFYCNGNLISKFKKNFNSSPANLSVNIGSENQNKIFQIDLLRLIDFGNTIESSIQNCNYINFNSDSSSIISNFSFDSDDLSLTKGKLNITSNGIQTVKSNAPIFARAPELNIKILSSVYELEWSGGDVKQAESYVLEKSVEGSQYFPVFTLQSYKSTDKIYSYLDKVDEQSDVVYYRVKQINTDGTVVYSSQVKVGQGIFEPFIVDQNYPNPFNPKTSITIELLEDAEVEITIYNLEGKEVQKLEKSFLTKGKHTFSFDGGELPSGVYLYKVSTPNFTQTKKMILAK